MYPHLDGDTNGPDLPAGWDPRLTEARNPRTEDIDRADAVEIVRLLQAEDRAVFPAVASQAAVIAALVEDVAARFRAGGRLIYVGAGTSGRLGVLDASECPPTFGTDPSLVRGLIAGGPAALVESSEGAEDDAEAGAAAVASLGVGPPDLVMGIATSGTTPWVHGALAEASARGAGTALLACSEPPASLGELVTHRILPLVGPEVIAGSTRLKAGTATKLVLNTITTGAMIRSGRVYRNLMVDLRARSAKLVDRGLRIVSHVTGIEREAARRLLLRAGGEVKTALAMHLLDADRWTAERCLDAADGFLGTAVERFAGAARPEYGIYPRAPDAAGPARLLERLGGAPERMAEAARGEAARREAEGRAGGAPAGDRVPPGASAWGPVQHIGHLASFEEEAIAPRVARWTSPRSGETPAFEAWEQVGTPPPAAELDAALDRFAAARARTLAPLEGAGPDLFALEGRLEGKTITLWQFLRGVASHDAAHERRIAERVHRALLRPAAP